MELTATKGSSWGLLSLLTLIFWGIRESNVLRTLLSFISTRWQVMWTSIKIPATPLPPLNSANEDCIDHKDQLIMSSGEVEMVMDRLGISHLGDGPNANRFGVEEVMMWTLFEEEEDGGGEPSLAELKEAFDVFDVNRDGYIDVSELRRVVGCLGQSQASNVEECRRMIAAFDQNGDGLIDFQEFLKLVEKCL